VIEFYWPIKMLHVIAVLCSGGLFFVRGLMVLNNRQVAMAAPVRYLSYSIDTVLLAAALLLVAMLPAGVFANGWLLEKIVLLVVYIVLGSFALKRARSKKSKAVCFVAAVSVYAFMYSVARAHHPLGIFHTLAN
jgi:uncharacterized membrane protein SirB2